MQRKLIALLITTILITTAIFAAELNRNGVSFQWDYSHLQPEDYNVATVSRNVDGDTITVNLDGWKLLSVSGEQEYHLSDSILQPGDTVSIHSGKDATGIVWTYSYIHNNRGDAVVVFDSHGELVDYFGWGEYK